jgi:putative heme transporter
LPPTPAGEGRRRSTLAVAAERSLQLLLIAAALAVAGFALVQLRLVVLTVLAALFLATALAPAARWLRRHRWPSALAALATIGAAGALLGGLLAAVAFAVAGELGDLGANARRGINEIVVWLTAGPLGLSERQIDDTLDRAVEQLRDRSDLIAGGLLALILLFFLLKDGDRIWRWLVELLPGRRRDDVDELARRAWSTLGGYLRGVSAVALIDPLLSAPRSRSSRCRWCCR